MARFLLAAGYSVLAFDLRAHGESEGDRFSLASTSGRTLLRRWITAALEDLRRGASRSSASPWVPEVADTWQHDAARIDDLLRIARDAHVRRPRAMERSRDVRGVADAVVDDRDHA